MAEMHSLFDSLQSFTFGDGQTGKFYSLPQLEKAEVGPISTLPVSLRIVLESVLRNYDGKRVREADVCAIANWEPNAERTAEIPFVVARVVLQDFTGVPLLVDLAAMRSTVSRHGAGRGPDRAAGAGGPDRGPLGPGGLFRGAERLAAQHGDGVQAQPRPLPVPQVGDAGVQRLLGRPARHRHHPPGQFRVSGEGRVKQRRGLLPGHAGRDGLAHDHDQRPGHRRLGRRRHRGRGGDAGAARLLPDPGRGGRQPHGRA